MNSYMTTETTGYQSSRQPYEETSPLMESSRSTLNYFYLFALLLILLLGVCAGSYLLFKEKGWDPVNHLPVNFVTFPNNQMMSFLETPAQIISLIEFNMPTEKYWLQNNKSFNFHIGQKGRIHEWLGWNYCCAACDNKTVIVSVLSSNDEDVPEQPIQQFRTLLEDAIANKKLQDCYSVLAPINNDNLLRIAGELTLHRRQCPLED